MHPKLSSILFSIRARRELFEACKSGDIHRVRSMVDAGNVNARDTAGRRSSPLHFAAGYGRREAVEHLLMMGGNVHARDDGGLIPLHNACSFGHAEVVSLLLSAGADPNARDSWSYTPLHEAAVKGKVCVVRAFLVQIITFLRKIAAISNVILSSIGGCLHHAASARG